MNTYCVLSLLIQLLSRNFYSILEATPEDNINTNTEEEQDTLSVPASRLRLEFNEIVNSSPLRETRKGMSEARSDPGRGSQRDPLSFSLYLSPAVTSEDHSRPSVGGRELQNLASANAPGLMEDLIRVPVRRQNHSYINLSEIMVHFS